MAHKDKQPRRPSKDVGIEKLHPSSDMNTRATGGDKESNEPLPRRMKGDTGASAASTPKQGRKSSH